MSKKIKAALPGLSSSPACLAAIEDGKCQRLKGHKGDHRSTMAAVKTKTASTKKTAAPVKKTASTKKLCGFIGKVSPRPCIKPRRHSGSHAVRRTRTIRVLPMVNAERIGFGGKYHSERGYIASGKPSSRLA